MRDVDKIASVFKLVKRFWRFAAILIILQLLLRGCNAAVDSREESDAAWREILCGMRAELDNSLTDAFVPMISYVNHRTYGTYFPLQQQVDSLIPLYGFLTAKMAIPEEGEHDTWQDETSTLELAFGESLTDGLNIGESDVEPWEEQPDTDSADGGVGQLLREENEAALNREGQIQTFTPHERQTQVDLDSLSGYEALVQQFYTIDANTMAGSDQLDVEKFMSQDMSLDKSEEVQILIYHTHSQEGFADSVPGDDSTTIMGVGEYLTQILTETYGYKVLHYYGKYDVKTRDDAYSNALPDVERILAENPSIEVVIDLHRDQMPEGTRLVTDVDGRPTAKFMFFNGLSRTKTTGNISYLYNENQNANLAFSFQMQLKAMEYYPGLTRRIYLKGYRYNMHLCPKYLLIELGAQNNTLEEAMNACEPLAHILDLVLSGQ